MLKLSGPINNLFVILEIKLGKAVFPFKIVFIITVNMLLPIAYINIIKSKGSQPVRNN